MATMKRRARLVPVLAFAALVALGAAGCAPATPTGPTDAPTQSPTPTPTATAVPVAAAPTPRFDLTCDDLITRGDLTTLFADPMSAENPATPDLATSDVIPTSDFVRTRGGLACRWSNGKVDDGSATRSAMSATFSLLPDAASGWKRYRTIYALKSDTESYCSGDTTITSCYLDAFVDGYWIEADFENIHAKLARQTSPVIAPAKAVFSKALATLPTLSTTGPLWTPPAGTLTAPRTCDGYVSPAQVKAALGTTARVVLGQGDQGGWSLGSEAEQDAAGFGCILGAGNTDNGYGYLSWLPGGAWAAKEAAVLLPGTPVTVAGLQAGDTVTMSTDATSKSIRVDIVVGGNWVHFDLWDYGATSDIPRATAPRTVAAKAIAAAIVATLRS
jgi:hypothetical protein